MTKMIFVNLPVADLDVAKAFYERIGFTNNPQFTDETAAAMVWSDAIYVMLLTRERWATFTSRPLPAEGASEVMLALSLGSRDEVDRMTNAAGAAGGVADVNPQQDHGFMYGRSFLDPDGHVWETTWMDMSAVPEHASESAAHERAS